MRYGLAALTYVTVVFLVCGSSFAPAFNSDDFIWLYDGSRMQNLADLFAIHRAPFAHYDGVRLNPTVNLFFALAWRTFGAHPAGYQAIIWLACVATALLIVAWLSQTGLSWGICFVSGLGFLFYPQHAEPMVWLSASGEVWVGLFTMVTLVCFTRWRRGHGAIWAYTSTAALLAALLAKECAIAVPFVVLLADYLLLSRDNAFRWQRHIASFASLGLVVLWKTVAFSNAHASIGIDTSFGNDNGLMGANFRYLTGAVIGFSGVSSLRVGHLAIDAVVAVYVMAIAGLIARGHRRFALHGVWLVVAIQPYVWFSPNSQLYGRYAWQASLPLCCLLGVGLQCLWTSLQSRVARAFVALAILAGLVASASALKNGLQQIYFADDTSALQGGIRTAIAGLPLTGDVYVYNQLNRENASGRAVVLFGGISPERVHDWYDVLQRERIHPQDRFIFWDGYSRSMKDLTAVAVRDFSNLRGRIPPGTPARDTGYAALWWDFGLPGDRAQWSTTRLDLIQRGNSSSQKLDALQSPLLNLSPFAVESIELTYRQRADMARPPLLGWRAANNSHFPNLYLPDVMRQQNETDIACEFHAPSHLDWWSGGTVRNLLLIPAEGSASSDLLRLRIYTFGPTH